MERTFVMLKPGVLQRRIVGEVLSRLERKGVKIAALKMVRMNKAMVETHYAEHQGKNFYEKLVEYTLSSPVIAMILEGPGIIGVIRRLVGATDVNVSPPGTIRGDFAGTTKLNIIHASDSPESAAREISFFFTEGEIFEWEDGNGQWF
jgi:nucleoside-diphosphate kinase